VEEGGPTKSGRQARLAGGCGVEGQLQPLGWVACIRPVGGMERRGSRLDAEHDSQARSQRAEQESERRDVGGGREVIRQLKSCWDETREIVRAERR
jgi:hypothetical protein